MSKDYSSERHPQPIPRRPAVAVEVHETDGEIDVEAWAAAVVREVLRLESDAILDIDYPEGRS